MGKEDQPVPDKIDFPYNPSYHLPGEDSTSKTKTPYRDHRPHSKFSRIATRYMKEINYA